MSSFTFPITFGSLAAGNQPLSDFDQNFNVCGQMGVIACSATGTNIVTLTSLTGYPTLTVLSAGQIVEFIPANNTTSLTTLGFSGLTQYNAYLQDGATQVGSGSNANLIAGYNYLFAFNPTLNSSVGGWQQLSSSKVNAINTLVVQTITTTGTYTPSAGMIYANVKVIGGGGGGGGAATGSTFFTAGGGGGGGGYSEATYTAATIGASQTATIGAAGTAGANTGGNGGTGGTSSLGSLLSATGGGGGAGANASVVGFAGGSGGAGSSGTFNISGNSGVLGISTSVYTISGSGGGTVLGGGGAGQQAYSTISSAGGAGGKYGGGGGGGISFNNASGAAGGAGAAGIVIITEYCSR